PPEVILTLLLLAPTCVLAYSSLISGPPLWLAHHSFVVCLGLAQPTSWLEYHAALPPSTSGQVSGTLPVLGSGPLATLVRTAKYWAQVSQMKLMITSILACFAAIEEGLQIAFITAQTASKHSSALALASKAPPSSLKTPPLKSLDM
ncbi:hypothetical protein C0995_014351, partial [Termitomyces sp. Mi166